MKRLWPIVVLIAALGVGCGSPESAPMESPAATFGRQDSVLADAFQNQTSNIQVQGEGQVVAILPDDNDGSRHQRFILRLGSGQTILIAHNIDLASRLSGLREGGAVEFYGEYEWNPEGGTVHWTHHDPAGRHPSGWLKFDGQTAQ